MHKLVALAFFVSISLHAAAPLEMPLWPNRPPGNEPELPPEKDLTKENEGKVAGKRLIRLGNVSQPTITVYPAPPDRANGAAVLVCPGGAYMILAMDLEGTEVCERLNSLGFTAVLLKYRVPKRPNQERHLAPLQDAQRAMGLIRQHADAWKIDPRRIGVLGFSAGGHLAAAVSNQSSDRTYSKVDSADDLNSRPDFSVLIYPAYLTPDKDITKISPELTLSTNTPQAFIAMAADDPVKVEGALAYAAALQNLKIPYELHVYPTGGHGYGLRETKEPVTTWPDRLRDWFLARGLDKAKN